MGNRKKQRMKCVDKKMNPKFTSSPPHCNLSIHWFCGRLQPTRKSMDLRASPSNGWHTLILLQRLCPTRRASKCLMKGCGMGWRFLNKNLSMLAWLEPPQMQPSSRVEVSHCSREPEGVSVDPDPDDNDKTRVCEDTKNSNFVIQICNHCFDSNFCI